MNRRRVPVYEAISVPHIEPLYGPLNQSGCKKKAILRKSATSNHENKMIKKKRTHAGIQMKRENCVSIINLQTLKPGQRERGPHYIDPILTMN